MARAKKVKSKNRTSKAFGNAVKVAGGAGNWRGPSVYYSVQPDPNDKWSSLMMGRDLGEALKFHKKKGGSKLIGTAIGGGGGGVKREAKQN